MTTIYNFDRATGIYVGSDVARLDPLDPNNPLVPAFATLVAPMPDDEVPEGMVRVFDIATEKWSLASSSLFQPPAPAETDLAPKSLDQLKDAAQKSIDAHFQVLYEIAVPNAAIANEYNAAYTTAKAWVEAGNPDPAPARVQATAESQGITTGEAAALVIQKWLEAESVLEQRGAARLRAKAAIRAATDQDGVFSAEAAGKAAMSAIVDTI